MAMSRGLSLPGELADGKQPEVRGGGVRERGRHDDREDGVQDVPDCRAEKEPGEPEQEAHRRAARGTSEEVERQRCPSPAHLDQGADLADHGQPSGAGGGREPDEEAEADERQDGHHDAQRQGIAVDCVVPHGMCSCVKQWQEGLPQPGGQLHSEQRIRQPFDWQQNHSPEVWQPSGQPPPCEQSLQG
jgi:hypothetical protein